MNNKFKIGLGAAAIVVALVLYVIVDVFVLEDGSMFTTAPTKADSVLRIEATGGDFRMYFVTPPEDPHMRCAVAFGTSKGGVHCYPKQNVKTTK